MAGAGEKAPNVGQDFTRPLSRLDLRWTFADQPDGAESNDITLRLEHPFQLSSNWKLSTRFDLPVINNTLSSTEEGKWGLGNMDVQAGLIHTFNPRFAAGSGIRAVFPSATENRFGSEQYQLLVGSGVRVSLPEISPGSFFSPQLQYNFDAESHSPHPISQLRIQPSFHVALPDQQFVTFLDTGDIRYNLESKKWFVPVDATYGKRWGNFISTVQVSYPIVDDMDLYDIKTVLRLGYFF